MDIPSTTDAALAELNAIAQFLNSIPQRTLDSHSRAGFLSGWLAAKGIDPETGEAFPTPVEAPPPDPTPVVEEFPAEP